MFIVIEGELIVTKNLLEDRQSQESNPDQIFDNLIRNSKQLLRYRIHEEKKIVTKIELEKLGKGSIVGLEDLFNNNPLHSVTVTVTS